MPLYEYKCGQCGQVFEVLQRFSDEPLTTHKVCGGPVERLISAPSFQFKGSGFYITDYARGSASSSQGKGESAGAGKNGGASKESKDSKESKPASGSSSSDSSSSSSSTSSSSSSTDTKK